MSKRSRKQKAEPVKEKPSASPPQSQPDRESENSFDFGGLPDRDLKKNLGCG